MRADITKKDLSSVFKPKSLSVIQLPILTGIHYGHPFAAPLAELLGILFLYLCSFHKAGHNIVAGLEGLFCSVHCTHIISWLQKRKDGDDG